MPNEPISSMTQVPPKGTLLLAAVDMSLPQGEKNVAISLGSIFGGARLWTSPANPAFLATAGDLCTVPTAAAGSRLWMNTDGTATGWVALV